MLCILTELLYLIDFESLAGGACHNAVIESLLFMSQAPGRGINHLQ